MQIQDATVQARNVSYALQTLGWKAFQDLCATIAAEIWGQTVQGFFESHDGGRDGAFRGIWTPKGGEPYSGSFTVQCKFTASAAAQLRLSDLEDEVAKAARLVSRGLADNYFLMTNARLTGREDEKITEEFKAKAGVQKCACYGEEWITRVINESPRLRLLVPRVYGLGDLSQILDERAYSQAQELLSSIGDELAKFVVTGAYKQTASALIEHGFVLLLGEPAAGKSTIAAALALGALDDLKCPTLRILDAKDFIKHRNPNEPKQFFWVDDAFGATQYNRDKVDDWNRVFPQVHAAIRHGAKILFTSRDYIYRAAVRDLKTSALPLLKESQVVIRVEKLTKDEKEQILYNHIRLGTQDNEFRKGIKHYLKGVAANTKFTPEIARRLGSPIFTKGLDINTFQLSTFVEHPLEFLIEVIQNLDSASRSALALIFSHGGKLASPVSIAQEDNEVLERFGTSLADVTAALNSLDGTLVLVILEDGQKYWRFKHPTIRDAFASIVAADNELLDIYLKGTPLDKLFDEISCGEVQLEGIKVVVPSTRYDLISKRIAVYISSQDFSRNKLNRFLAYRCSRAFLEYFITENPKFIEGLHVWSYIYTCSDLLVAIRLKSIGLLPEAKRAEMLKYIESAALLVPDAYFLDNELKSFFESGEIEGILEKVETKLLPDLKNVVSEWASRYDPSDSEDPTDHFYELQHCLELYRDEFDSRSMLSDDLENALSKIDIEIDELASYYGKSDSGSDDDYDWARDSGHYAAPILRSIFDDVDG